MSEIKINIQDRYLRAFLELLQTLNYVQVKEIGGVEVKQNGESATEAFLKTLSANDPLRKAIQPTRAAGSADTLVQEQGYLNTDWKRLSKLAKDLDIQEPTDDLLAQLTA